MPVAKWEGAILAESKKCVVAKGDQYFPADSVKMEFLKPSKTTTTCPDGGIANYYDVVVNGKTIADGAWCYANPKPQVANIKGMIAFATPKGVLVEA